MDTPEPTQSATPIWIEFAGFFIIVIAGLLPRVLFIKAFPTLPTSDFLNLLNFSILMRDNWLAKDAWQWHYFSPGMPLITSVLLRFTQRSPETIIRWATVFATGLVPLVPYIIWRNVFTLRTRIMAALLLALWPGQIIFSGVFAQDNWIIFPTVALTTLTIRILVLQERGFPVWAALLYGITVSIRQEMMIALLPVTIIAAIGVKKQKWIANFTIGAFVTLIVFLLLVLQRGMATGRYALSSDHLGVSILGSYIPGAGIGWISPIQYVETTHPEIMEQGILEEKALELTKNEFMNRPMFHIIRVIISSSNYLIDIDKELRWWSLSPDVLPKQAKEHINPFVAWANPILSYYPSVIHAFFIGAIFIIIHKRNLLQITWPVLLTILLKLGLHAVIVSQPRYFLVVIALEMLIISIALDAVLKPYSPKLLISAVVVGCIGMSIFTSLTAIGKEYIITHTGVAINGSFLLFAGETQINCSLVNGSLIYYGASSATIKMPKINPQPKETTTLACTAKSKKPQHLSLSIHDLYATGGFPNRILQVVSVNGDKVFQNDIAKEAWAGWIDVDLGMVDKKTPLKFSVELRAVKPDPGWLWGEASITDIRVIEK